MRAKAGAQGEAFQGAPVLSAVGAGGRLCASVGLAGKSRRRGILHGVQADSKK
jgi:hypothetical protein